jgi:hypothetical protein
VNVHVLGMRTTAELYTLLHGLGLRFGMRRCGMCATLKRNKAAYTAASTTVPRPWASASYGQTFCSRSAAGSLAFRVQG